MNNKPDFTWNAIDIDEVELSIKGRESNKIYEITLRELPKIQTDKLLADLYGEAADKLQELRDTATATEKAAAADPEGKAVGMTNVEYSKKLSEITSAQSAILFKYLGFSAKDPAQNQKFFEKLEKEGELTYTAIAGLTKALIEVCHLDEIAAAAGNMLALPGMYAAAMQAPAEQASSESPSQPTTPA